MQSLPSRRATSRYAKVIEVSKRVRWEIERDVIRGRDFAFDQNFLPAGLSLVDELDVPDGAAEAALLSQVQGRTYANMFGLVERFIGAKMLEVSREHALGDQAAFEALVRFTDEELKHQALFRRIERDARRATCRPATASPPSRTRSPARCSSQVAPGRCSALTCHIELFIQAHYRASIDAGRDAVAALEGRLPVPLARGVAARDPRRARVAARGRQARRRASATPRSTT